MDGTLQPGDQLGGYRIEELLGRGGMGVVYRAEQGSIGRQVALKVLAPELVDDAGFRQRFLRESRIAAQLDHPNVIPVYDAGEIDGRLYIAMRYVDGADLHVLVRSGGPLDPGRAFGLLRQVAGALDAAHARGVVHRDVKPANVLVSGRSGGGEADEHAYLCDFGIGKQFDRATELTRTGEVIGTASYLAPEQARGDPINGRADAYALACVLFECLTGSVPFVRDTMMATVSAHLQAPIPMASAVRPGLGPDLDAVFQRALAKDPGDRYPSCRTMIVAAQEAYGRTASAQQVAPAGAYGVAPLAASQPGAWAARPDYGVPPAPGTWTQGGRDRGAPRGLGAAITLGLLALVAVVAVVFAVRGLDLRGQNQATDDSGRTAAPTETTAPAGDPAAGDRQSPEDDQRSAEDDRQAPAPDQPADDQLAEGGSPTGAPTSECVSGWTTPEVDTPPRATPLNAIRALIGVSGQFFVDQMRLFSLPEGDSSYWYVRASQVDDPSIRGRWLVEQRVGDEARVVAQADYVSRGYVVEDWQSVGPDGPIDGNYVGISPEYRGCLEGD